MAMAFDENYGKMPVKTLRLIKKMNVSPADFDLMTDILGFVAYKGNGEIDWTVIERHIIDNSQSGYYNACTF